MRYFYPSTIPQVVISAAQSGPSGILEPRGIAVDKQGAVYVSNAGRNTISRILFNGTSGWNATTWAINVNGWLNQPGPITFGIDGRLEEIGC